MPCMNLRCLFVAGVGSSLPSDAAPPAPGGRRARHAGHAAPAATAARPRRPARGCRPVAARAARGATPRFGSHSTHFRLRLLKIILNLSQRRASSHGDRPETLERPALATCVELVLAFRIPTNKPSLPLRSHAPCSGLHREYHETHAVSCPSALRVDPPGCMHASSETHAVSECPMFRHTCVAQSPTPFPPYSHP